MPVKFVKLPTPLPSTPLSEDPVFSCTVFHVQDELHKTGQILFFTRTSGTIIFTLSVNRIMWFAIFFPTTVVTESGTEEMSSNWIIHFLVNKQVVQLSTVARLAVKLRHFSPKKFCLLWKINLFRKHKILLAEFWFLIIKKLYINTRERARNKNVKKLLKIYYFSRNFP